MLDDLGKQLHDKATRGITLSVDEQTQLEAWYTAQDQAESQQLNSTDPQGLTMLRNQVEGAIHQLESVSQRIQELTVQNDSVRQEIGRLQRQLSYRSTSQAA